VQPQIAEPPLAGMRRRAKGPGLLDEVVQVPHDADAVCVRTRVPGASLFRGGSPPVIFLADDRFSRRSPRIRQGFNGRHRVAGGASGVGLAEDQRLAQLADVPVTLSSAIKNTSVRRLAVRTKCRRYGFRLETRRCRCRAPRSRRTISFAMLLVVKSRREKVLFRDLELGRVNCSGIGRPVVAVGPGVGDLGPSHDRPQGRIKGRDLDAIRRPSEMSWSLVRMRSSTGCRF